MGLPIEDWVQRAFATFIRLLQAFGTELWDHTLGLLDPIIARGVEVFGIVAVCAVIGWFFPAVRSFFGAIALGSITWLVGFYKGEQAEKDYLKKHPPKRK